MHVALTCHALAIGASSRTVTVPLAAPGSGGGTSSQAHLKIPETVSGAFASVFPSTRARRWNRYAPEIASSGTSAMS
jgi:hypothetical protein